MNCNEQEIITNSKSIDVIKKKIFDLYPELIPYSNCCKLEREFGEEEICGINKITFTLSPNKKVAFIIVYSEEAS